MNHCESKLREGLKFNNTPKYYMKLQVHPLAHHKTVADYLVMTKNYNYAIECKECAGNAFAFDRLTQQDKLLDFHRSLDRNKSYLCLLFWRERMSKSYMFLIPIINYLKIISNIPKKSINLNECLVYMPEFLLEIKDSVPNLESFFNNTLQRV